MDNFPLGLYLKYPMTANILCTRFAAHLSCHHVSMSPAVNAFRADNYDASLRPRSIIQWTQTVSCLKLEILQPTPTIEGRDQIRASSIRTI